MNLFGRGMIGSVGKPAGYVAPCARELAAVALVTGTMSAGDISMGGRQRGRGHCWRQLQKPDP